MSDEHEDKIFVRGHFTDFEKLLFAQDEIKQLKKNNSELSVEIGKAQSYITELEDTIRQLNANPRSAEEKKELRELYDKMMYNAKTAVCKHVIMRNGTCVSWSLNNTRF